MSGQPLATGEDLDRLVAGAAEKNARRHPGLVVGAVDAHRTRQAVAGMGHIRLPAGPAPTDTTLSEIGSITKVFTGLLLAIAVVRREVTLDTPVRELLPTGTTAPSRDGMEITLEHLTTHRSGLPRTPVGFRTEVQTVLLGRGNPYSEITDERLLEFVARTELRGSSESWVGEPSGGQDHSESVVCRVAEAAGDPSVEFDDAVNGLGAAVVGSAGGEVGQELVLPGPQGAAEPGDLGDRAGGERGEHLLSDRLALDQVRGRERRAQLLVAAPRHGDLVVGVAGLETGLDPLDLAGGQLVRASAQRVADPVERIILAAAVAELVLLHPAPGFLHRLQAELDHVEGVQDGGGVFQLVTDRVAVAAERVQGGGAEAGGEGVPAGT